MYLIIGPASRDDLKPIGSIELFPIRPSAGVIYYQLFKYCVHTTTHCRFYRKRHWALHLLKLALPASYLLTARYAKWHVGQQQRYATSACPWPSSVDFPMSGLICSFLLQWYATMLSWASLCAVFPLVSRKGPS